MDYLPAPRMYQWQLTRLQRRCDLAPQVAIYDIYYFMNELLAEMCIFTGPAQTQLLLKISRNPEVAR